MLFPWIDNSRNWNIVNQSLIKLNFIRCSSHSLNEIESITRIYVSFFIGIWYFHSCLIIVPSLFKRPNSTWIANVGTRDRDGDAVGWLASLAKLGHLNYPPPIPCELFNYPIDWLLDFTSNILLRELSFFSTGVDRFIDNLEMMYGFRIEWLNFMMKLAYLVVTPLTVMIIFVMNCISYR